MLILLFTLVLVGSAQAYCQNKPTQTLACEDITNQETCDEYGASCAWGGAVCTTQQGSINCTPIGNQSSCESVPVKCEWIDPFETEGDCEALRTMTCSDLQTQVNCDEFSSNCFWFSDACSTIFGNPVCTQLDTRTNCQLTSGACSWNANPFNLSINMTNNNVTYGELFDMNITVNNPSLNSAQGIFLNMTFHYAKAAYIGTNLTINDSNPEFMLWELANIPANDTFTFNLTMQSWSTDTIFFTYNIFTLNKLAGESVK